MKLIIPLLFLSAFSLCAQTGATKEDVLYVKDGSIVTGKIIEIVDGKTVKIRSAQGEVLEYRVADLRKVEIDSVSEMNVAATDPPSEWETMKLDSEPHKKWSVSVGGGMAMPVGAFGSTSGDDAGLAAMGWMAVVEGCNSLLPHLDAVTSGVAAFNGLDFSALDAQGYNVNPHTSPWTSLWVLTGLRAYAEVEPGTEFYGMGQAGIFFGFSPRIESTSGTASPAAFGFGLAAGARTSGVDLSVRYLRAAADYETIKIPGTYKVPPTPGDNQPFTVRTIGMKPGHAFYRQSIGCIMFTCAFFF